MKSNVALERFMNSPKIKNLGITKETAVEILKEYNDVALNVLLEQGYIELGNGLQIEIIKILDRVHVLRGIAYKSTRQYKLKISMDENIYKKVDDYYTSLMEDIL